jgi:flagellar P-ring protein precursor FlgI
MAIVPLLISLAGDAHAVRIKDIGYFEGVRPNQLIGYGLVVGLDGTGDSERAAFTPQTLETLLSRVGIRVDAAQLTLRNVAAVMVTASLPAFAKPGTTIDVTVSSIGDARSLVGGTLLMAPLNGADGQVYAVSQGQLKVGSDAIPSFSARQSSSRRKLNVGRVPDGGLVERAVPVTLGADGVLRFLLSRPDFQTAMSVSDAVNGLTSTLSAPSLAAPGAPASVTGPDAAAAERAARVVDSSTIEITVPDVYEEDISSFIARLEVLDVRPDAVARVVVNGRTGAVVLGGNVRLSQAAIAYEGLTLELAGQPLASDAPPDAAAGAAGAPPPAPGAPAAGTTVAPAPSTTREIVPSGLQIVDESTTLAELVSGLNALGVTAQELIDILEALSAAGALHAQLEVL